LHLLAQTIIRRSKIIVKKPDQIGLEKPCGFYSFSETEGRSMIAP
jgi:hypothetical protein